MLSKALCTLATIVADFGSRIRGQSPFSATPFSATVAEFGDKVSPFVAIRRGQGLRC